MSTSRKRKQVHVVTSEEFSKRQSQETGPISNSPSDPSPSPLEAYAKLVFEVIQFGVTERCKSALTYRITEQTPPNEATHILIVRRCEDELVKKLKTVGGDDIRRVFSTLCRSTEIPADNGDCLSTFFKWESGNYEVKVDASKPWAKVQDESPCTQPPALVWVNIVGDARPLLVPNNNATFGKVSSHNLVGVIYGENGVFSAAVQDDGGSWKCLLNGRPMQTSQVLQTAMRRGVSLLYYNTSYREQPFNSSRRPVMRSLTNFELHPHEEEEIRAYYDGRAHPGSNWVGFVAKKSTDNVGALTKMQRIAGILLGGAHALHRRAPFCLSPDEFDALVSIIGNRREELMVHQVLNETTETRIEIKTKDGKIFATLGNHRTRTFCTVCLRDAESRIEHRGRRYCRFHFPAGSVNYAIFLATPITQRRDLRNSVEWRVVSNGSKKPKPPADYSVAKTCLYLRQSLEEASSLFHALSVVNWLHESLSGRSTAKKRVWLDNQMRELLPELRELYRQIFQDFYIKFDVKESASEVWSQEKALKFGFIFGKKSVTAKFRNIYSIHFGGKDRQRELVYVGKNSVVDSDIESRERKLPGTLLENKVLALTPSLKMLNFLEPSFQASVAVSSLLGLQSATSSRGVVYQNCYMEPIEDTPLRISLDEYISEILSEMLGFKLSVNLDVAPVDALLR